MVLCSARGLSLAVSQQSAFTHDDTFTNPNPEKTEQFSHFAGRAGLAVGSLSLVVGIATPAHANTPYTPVPSEYSGQSRIEKLQQLQAGVSAERRIQAQQLRDSEYYQSQSEEAQFAPAQYNQAQYEPTDYGQGRNEQAQYEQPVSHQAPVAEPINTAPNSYLNNALNRPADGVYLYGQQPVANQLETAYFVFEAQEGAVTGAFYMPSSSFDCAQGQIRADHMALTVTDSYSQEVSNYALDLDSSNAQVASTGSVIVSPPSISGFHQLPVSNRDRSLLATCQAKY